MAATISRDTVDMFDKSGNKERRILAYTGPASYLTGGDPLTPEQIALSKIEAIVGMTIANAALTVVYWGIYDFTNKKILWYSATGTQVSNATDLSGFTGRFEAIGR
jgi:hypothetical protein